MSLTDQLRSSFSAGAISNGKKLYRRGQVETVWVSDDQLMTFVTEEGERYVIVVDVASEDTGVGCTCDTFQTIDLCAHIWGSLVAAEEEDGLGSIGENNAEIVSLDPEEIRSLRSDIEQLSGGGKGDREGVRPESTAKAPDVQQKRKASSEVSRNSRRTGSTRNDQLDWKDQINRLAKETRPWANDIGNPGKVREACYIVNGRRRVMDAWSYAPEFESITLDVAYREQKKNGEFGALRFHSIRPEMISHFATEADRRILSFLDTVCAPGFSFSDETTSTAATNYDIPARLIPIVLDMIAPTGRLRYHDGQPDQNLPLEWRPEEYWEPVLDLEIRNESHRKRRRSARGSAREESENEVADLTLKFTHGEESVSAMDAPYLATGILRVGDRIVRVAAENLDSVVNFFYRNERITVPVNEISGVMEKIAGFGQPLRLISSEDLPISSLRLEPIPAISFHTTVTHRSNLFVRGFVTFIYGERSVPSSDTGSGIWKADTGELIIRDRETESEAIALLQRLGFRHFFEFFAENRNAWDIPHASFVPAASELIDRGWVVEAEGRSYQSAGGVELEVTSGQDWFDISGRASFGEGGITFPELLMAIRDGKRFVALDDGTYGIIPDEWVERYGKFSGKIDRAEGVVRFGSNQMVLLDLMLDEMPEASFDETYLQARKKLQSFDGIEPHDPPDTFRGQLRPYQQIALGWFSFLRDFNFGGCLADDMGLGKTVQVLALLEERRVLKRGKPSLAVVPKSLIFNWIREAERFTPELRTLDYTGVMRSEYTNRFGEFDLILTTYGTLRRDIAELREVEFDYLILDESQAIKNARSATAKASRLLQGDHRLAMSGTPIENRIEELWSLFEFLNPGMLGSRTGFGQLTAPPKEANEGSGDKIEATRQSIGRVLRPFILRRTKLGVAPDLPERVEQTLYCELGGTQRRLYNELLDYIRADVMGEVQGKGIRKSSFKILEGLLRLRQAASHPGLLDAKRSKGGCAKFDVLLPKLSELIAEGQKVLIFSQFTSLLELLKGELKEEKLRYEYLDGKTKDRQGVVDRFQNSPEIPLFLISLKAGGVGLNLTAASWVFLLDPWWNPAVEAQAIDRTHRIGQTSTVFANRLIARDTIEEKVLALQQQKRELADSIITGENSLIKDLQKEDLEMLLS